MQRKTKAEWLVHEPVRFCPMHSRTPWMRAFTWLHHSVFQQTISAGWWFQPILKILVKLDHFSNRDEHHKYFKPPPSLAFFLEMSAILDKLSRSPNLLTFPKVFHLCWLVYYGSFRNGPTTHHYHASGKCKGSSESPRSYSLASWLVWGRCIHHSRTKETFLIRSGDIFVLLFQVK